MNFGKPSTWAIVKMPTPPPSFPIVPGRDIRDYLSLETIAGDGNFIMHGNYPAAVIFTFRSATTPHLRRLHARPYHQCRFELSPHNHH